MIYSVKVYPTSYCRRWWWYNTTKFQLLWFIYIFLLFNNYIIAINLSSDLNKSFILNQRLRTILLSRDNGKVERKYFKSLVLLDQMTSSIWDYKAESIQCITKERIRLPVFLNTILFVM